MKKILLVLLLFISEMYAQEFNFQCPSTEIRIGTNVQGWGGSTSDVSVYIPSWRLPVSTGDYLRIEAPDLDPFYVTVVNNVVEQQGGITWIQFDETPFAWDFAPLQGADVYKVETIPDDARFKFAVLNNTNRTDTEVSFQIGNNTDDFTVGDVFYYNENKLTLTSIVPLTNDHNNYYYIITFSHENVDFGEGDVRWDHIYRKPIDC